MGTECCPTAGIATQFPIVPIPGSHVGGHIQLHESLWGNSTATLHNIYADKCPQNTSTFYSEAIWWVVVVDDGGVWG